MEHKFLAVLQFDQNTFMPQKGQQYVVSELDCPSKSHPLNCTFCLSEPLN